MKYTNIKEEELKNKVAQDYFWNYNCTKIIGNVDFCICLHTPLLPSTTGVAESHGVDNSNFQFLLWAEAKKGQANIYHSLVQLILTIGKARTFDKYLPPAYLGAFDYEKIAFVPYSQIHDVFYTNDFNWNVTPSNHNTKEFKLVYDKVKNILDANALIYQFETDTNQLKAFIKQNFVYGKHDITKTQIDKNNFMIIYSKWLQAVKPTIAVNWDVAKKAGIIDGDFYLADILSQNNQSLKEKLFVILNKDHYVLDKKLDDMGMFSSRRTDFTDNQKAHTQFWIKYQRPPKQDYWEHILNRRDLLVPQDVRERKGSFFTPPQWVELSQKYLTDVLGENWQDEYYIWDCAAGTGNLLHGLTNKYNIWASTLDKQDVDVMHQRIDTMNQNSVNSNGASLLKDHIFQFDFLNDDFTKLPPELQNIINNEKKRKKLVVYINPPYAEHGNRATFAGKGEHKSSVANTSKIYAEFSKTVGTATRELFAQFFLRVHEEIPNCHLASFSTLKFINSQNFLKFRQYLKGEFQKGFICNANTFDNVKGNFPIAFLIWDLSKQKEVKQIETDIINENSEFFGLKSFYAFGSKDFISSWLRKFYDKENEAIGYLILPGVDMQQQNGVYFTSQPTESDIKAHKTAIITKKNLIEMSIYLSIRIAIESTWINNRDQFLYPNDKWQSDTAFQNDCLAYTLFHGQNRILTSSPILLQKEKEGNLNHWIPFTEAEVNAKEKFASNFMTDFIKGKIKTQTQDDLFTTNSPPSKEEYPKWEVVKKAHAKVELINYNNLPYLKTFRKELRKDLTPAETALWNALKSKRIEGRKFRRQHSFGNYILDFYCPSEKLAIELDGEYHFEHTQAEKDADRDLFLNLCGIRVLRFENKIVFENIDALIENVKNYFGKQPLSLSDSSPFKGEQLNSTHTNSPPSKEEYPKGEVVKKAYPKGNEIQIPLQFSAQATAVFDAGCQLWVYYHKQKNINVNASLYDIKSHFQGRNKTTGRMNNKSADETYNKLISKLRDALKTLSKQIELKVYEYGFLKA